MAELVRENVVETRRVVDYFGGELDAAVVSDCGLDICGKGAGAEADLLAPPVGASGGRLEGRGPDEFDAAGGCAESRDLSRGDGFVELGEEGGGKGVFFGGKGFTLGADGFDAWIVRD